MRHLRARCTLLARPPPPLDPFFLVHRLRSKPGSGPPQFVTMVSLLRRLEKFLSRIDMDLKPLQSISWTAAQNDRSGFKKVLRQMICSQEES